MQQVRQLVRFSLHRRLRFSLYHIAFLRILLYLVLFLLVKTIKKILTKYRLLFKASRYNAIVTVLWVYECVLRTTCWIHHYVVYMLYMVLCGYYVESNSVLVVADRDNDTTSLPFHNKERSSTKRRGMKCGIADMSMLPLKCVCFLARLAKHNRPRCLRVINWGIHAPHPRDPRGVILKPLKPAILVILEYLRHLGPCRQHPLSSLE